MLQVCREQDLLLFLQEHPAFTLAPQQPFQLAGVEEVSVGGTLWRGWGNTYSQALLSPPVLTQVSLLLPGDDGASLEKEARRWATRVARDRKNKANSEEVGAVLPHGARGCSRRSCLCAPPAPATP